MLFALAGREGNRLERIGGGWCSTGLAANGLKSVFWWNRWLSRYWISAVLLSGREWIGLDRRDSSGEYVLDGEG